MNEHRWAYPLTGAAIGGLLTFGIAKGTGRGIGGTIVLTTLGMLGGAYVAWFVISPYS